MKTLVLLIGFALLALGIAALVPGLAVDGVLFGIFPVTTGIALAFIATGAVGVMIGMSRRRELPPMRAEGNDLRDF